MINVIDSFNLSNSANPLDARNKFTSKEAMQRCNVCDEGHICYCEETHKTYRFRTKDDNGNTKTYDNSEGGLGYWEEFQPSSGGGEGTITGATIGGNSVTESGGVLQFPAYPTVPITGIKQHGAENVITPNQGIVELPEIPTVPITGIKQGDTTLTPVGGIVTVTDFQPSINSINNKLQQIANQEPITVPVSAVNLPTSGNFTYDPDTTYVMLISGVQSPTIHYPYTSSNTNYAVFKAIDSDLYYVYSVSGTTYTYSDSYTWSTLPANAKAKFESGIYAVKQVINNDGTIPEGSWKHGVPSVFVTRHNYPIRYRQINENSNYYILLKNDEVNKIYKYAADANSKWSLVTNGCYTKGDTTTGADYDKYDKYFDRHDAIDVDYDNTNSGMAATNVNAAIDETFTTLKHTSGSATVSSGSFTLPNTVTGNTYYDITNTPITSLTIPSINSPYEVVIKFTTHSTNTCTVTIPNNQKYIGDFSVGKGVTYIMSIFNGVIIIAETETYTNS